MTNGTKIRTLPRDRHGLFNCAVAEQWDSSFRRGEHGLYDAQHGRTMHHRMPMRTFFVFSTDFRRRCHTVLAPGTASTAVSRMI